MKKEEIYLSESFEIFLSYLYGKNNYHQYATGAKSNFEWKETIDKVLDSIESSIQNTLEVSDKAHKDNLLFLCQDTRKRISNSSDLNDLNEKTILGFIKLVFYLIGDRPEHNDLLKVNKPEHWKLNSHRQIMYYQSNEHKVSLIIDRAPAIDQFNDGKYNKNKLLDKLHRDFSGDNRKFLDWFKNEHLDKYNELF